LSSYWVRCVAFKPDNANILVSGSNDKTIKVWDMPSGSCLSTLNVGSGVNSVQFRPIGDTVAAGCDNDTVQIIDVATAQVKRPLDVDSRVWSVAFSADGTLAAACGNGKIYLVDPTAGEIKSSLSVDNPVTSLSYAPSADILAVGDSGGSIHFFNSQGEKLQSPVRGHRYTYVLFSMYVLFSICSWVYMYGG
jgi:WD40 repeat protein